MNTTLLHISTTHSRSDERPHSRYEFGIQGGSDHAGHDGHRFGVVTRPYPPLLLRVFSSSAAIWVLSRVIYVVVLIVGTSVFGLLPSTEAIRYALHPVWPARLLLVLLTAVLIQVDRKLAHEHLLQANFGVFPVWFSATATIGAGVSDLVLQTLLNVIGRSQ